jgi:uncharacterized protein YfdQ (DUF2303 family)
MTETTSDADQVFNPKPDTAEGVGAILHEALRFVDTHGTKIGVTELTAPDGTKALIVIDNDRAAPIPDSAFDHERERPRRRKGTALLLDLDSFIDHAKRFSDPESVVFADNNREHPSLTAVLDYHPEGSTSAPRWGEHRGKFAFPLSDEWQAWHEYSGKQMDMVNFARFLEDHIVDVLPSGFLTLNEDQQRYIDTLGGTDRIAEPAKLMEIATGLQLFERAETVNAVRLETGEANMTFVSQHQDAGGGSLKVPSLFVIGIPVLVNGPAYQILVRLRYRSNGGKVVFFYELWRTDRVFDHAFDEAVEKVRAGTGLPVLLGHPE